MGGELVNLPTGQGMTGNGVKGKGMGGELRLRQTVLSMLETFP
jgi:hypothetical protein